MSFTLAWRAAPGRGVEYLDDPAADPKLAARSLRDVALCNRLFGGIRAVTEELRQLFNAARATGRPLTLLDVGTGAGDVPAAARRAAAKAGVALHTVGMERSVALAAASRELSGTALAGDAFAIPFADHSVDIVVCAQVLHHFAAPDGARLLAELHRVARQRVIVSELRRSRVAAAGVWLASWPLGFHPVSRHDGVLSVMRGFRADELARAVLSATGVRPNVRNRRGFRVTASWSPA